MSVRATELPVVARDGHRFAMQARIPASPHSTLIWHGGMRQQGALPFPQGGAGFDEVEMGRQRGALHVVQGPR